MGGRLFPAAAACAVLITSCSSVTTDAAGATSTSAAPRATTSSTLAMAPTSAAPLPASTTTAQAAQAKYDFAPLVTFVEETRGRSFRVQPNITLLPPGPPPEDEFGVLTTLDWAFIQLMGLATDKERAHFDAFVERQRETRGFGRCCPVVAQEVAGDLDRTTAIVVHELAHLIDAAPLEFGGTIEERAYVMAGAEGNAVRIEEQYLKTIGRSLADIRSEDDPVPDGVPEQVVALTQSAYVEGYRFAVAIAEAGGEDAIDAALENAPRSSEQVMFPSAYLEGEEPMNLDNPQRPEGSVLLRWGTIGSFVLKLAMEREIGEDAAIDVVRNWAGDAYVLSRLDDEICITADIVMDDAASAEALAAALGASMAPTLLDVSAAAIHLEHCRAEM